MCINSFHNHFLNSLIIIINVCYCKTTSMQLMALILVHRSQLIDKPVLGVKKQL